MNVVSLAFQNQDLFFRDMQMFARATAGWNLMKIGPDLPSPRFDGRVNEPLHLAMWIPLPLFPAFMNHVIDTAEIMDFIVIEF